MKTFFYQANYKRKVVLLMTTVLPFVFRKCYVFNFTRFISAAFIVRFITEKFIGDYDPNLGESTGNLMSIFTS